LRLVLDSNEYIYAFGVERKPECEALLQCLADPSVQSRLFVPQSVADEVRRNMRSVMFKQCHRFWNAMACAIDDESDIPSRFQNAYLTRGLKAADAQIAAYAEWVGADFLISENRDFLALTKPLPFRVLKAAEFLKERGII
jgi:hypothetical protein